MEILIFVGVCWGVAHYLSINTSGRNYSEEEHYSSRQIHCRVDESDRYYN